MKVDPYLRPLYDAMYEMMGTESYQKYFERGQIEVSSRLDICAEEP